MTQRDEVQWWVSANETDIDEAYDSAKASALETWGSSFPGSDLYPDDFARDETPRPLDVIIRNLGEVPAPRAFALSNARDWASRKARVVLTDPSLTLPLVTEATLQEASEALDVALVQALEVLGKGLVAGESLSQVTLLSIRQRTKVVLVRNPAPSQKRFGVFANNQLVATEDTSSLAGKKARELTPLYGATEVWGLAGREGEKPLIEAINQVVSQRAVFSVVITRQKSPDKNRLAGWFFAGPNDLPKVDSPLVASPEGLGQVDFEVNGTVVTAPEVYEVETYGQDTPTSHPDVEETDQAEDSE
jgi:hypothetical protein